MPGSSLWSSGIRKFPRNIRANVTSGTDAQQGVLTCHGTRLAPHILRPPPPRPARIGRTHTAAALAAKTRSSPACWLGTAGGRPSRPGASRRPAMLASAPSTGRLAGLATGRPASQHPDIETLRRLGGSRAGRRPAGELSHSDFASGRAGSHRFFAKNCVLGYRQRHGPSNSVAGGSCGCVRSGFMVALPPASTEEAFTAIGRDEGALRPGIERLCRLLGVNADDLTRFPAGSRLAYTACGLVLKLSPPVTT